MTDKLRQAAEMAVEALAKEANLYESEDGPPDSVENAMNALRQALAEPDMGIDRGAWSDVPDATKWVDELRGDEEPPNSTTDVVKPYNGWVLRNVFFEDGEPLMHSEPEWQGLTDEEREYLWGVTPIEAQDRFAFALAVEAKLKEKNCA